MLKFLDLPALEQALAPFVPDPADRQFVARCVVGEGPAHHRGANYVLLKLLARALEKAGGAKVSSGPAVSVPMHIPPHLRGEGEPQDYPVRLPTAPLEALAPGRPREIEAMADCLTDGPPQHAVANALMVAMLGALLEALEKK